MKKRLFFCSGIITLSLFMLAEGNDLLKVEASVNPGRLSRGQEGKVILKVSVREGITISPQPSFRIEFNSSQELVFPKNFFTASDLEIETAEENGREYLDLEEPIEIPFTVNLEASRGYHVLKGRIKYFACHLEEGWCLKTHMKFSAPFYTRRSVVRKR